MQKYTPSFYRLCAITTFLSAFLLFQIQPLISKHILPWFGGSSMVWITALFFFMLILLAGYIYVLIISYYSLKIQKSIHSFVLIIVSLILLYHHLTWTSGVTPIFSEHYFGLGPVLAILSILSVSIGAPFFLLSTTSSLLQLWYGNSTGKEPFSLYAVSNIGSLLGLLSYPFLFEPIFTTATQGVMWTVLFALYIVCLLVVLFNTTLLPHEVTEKISVSPPQKRQALNLIHFLKWI